VTVTFAGGLIRETRRSGRAVRCAEETRGSGRAARCAEPGRSRLPGTVRIALSRYGGRRPEHARCRRRMTSPWKSALRGKEMQRGGSRDRRGV